MTPTAARTADRPQPVDAEQVAHAALSVPDVDSLSAGPLGQYRTYLPGRTVAGVRVEDDVLRLDVVVRLGRSFAAIAADLDAELAPLMGDRRLALSVADVVQAPRVDSRGGRR